MITQALLFSAIISAPIDDRPRGGGSAVGFDGTFSTDADLDGYKLYMDRDGDPNTYCWSSGADTIVCQCGGVDTLTMNATDSVFETSLDVKGGLITEGDGSYSWDHTPTGFATEGSVEIDGQSDFDGAVNVRDTFTVVSGASIWLDDDVAQWFGSDSDFEIHYDSVDGRLEINGSGEALRIDAPVVQVDTFTISSPGSVWFDDDVAQWFGSNGDLSCQYDSTDDRLEFSGKAISLEGEDFYNIDGIWHDAVSTDTAPRVMVLATQPICTIPGASNVTGANLVLAPSPGESTLEGVTRTGTTGDTLTFSVWSNGILTTTVKTEGTDWDCDGAASDIECVCNLFTELDSDDPIAGVAIARSDGTCSDEKLTFNVIPGTSEFLYVVTSDDTNLDMTNGGSGSVLIPSLPSANGDQGTLVFGSKDANGIMIYGYGNYLTVRRGDNGDYKSLYIDDVFAEGWLRAGDAEFLGIDQRLKIQCSATGVCSFTNWAGQGVELNVVTDNQAKWGDEASGTLLSYNVAQTETVPDNGGGTNATATFTPTSNTIVCDCDDAQGCDITMGETGMATGMLVTIVGETAVTCEFSDADGVGNLTGAFSMGDDDTLQLLYSVDEWVEVSRSDN